MIIDLSNALISFNSKTVKVINRTISGIVDGKRIITKSDPFLIKASVQQLRNNEKDNVKILLKRDIVKTDEPLKVVSDYFFKQDNEKDNIKSDLLEINNKVYEVLKSQVWEDYNYSYCMVVRIS